MIWKTFLTRLGPSNVLLHKVLEIRTICTISEKSLKELCSMKSKQWGKLEKSIIRKYDEDEESVNSLLADGVETCTTFTVFLMKQASFLQFALGNTGNYRLAWSRDGILIDSSARLENGILKQSGNLQYL